MSKMKVLAVDDNRTNLHILQVFLKKLGHDVILAENGEEAVAHCAESNYELIFMDARMPRMDGLEATRALRASGNTAYIIGVSADAMTEERNEALAAGMNDYVVKPVVRDALAASIDRWRQTLIAAHQAESGISRR